MNIQERDILKTLFTEPLNEEREINLIDLVADILSHWRGLLIFMLAGAVLMTESSSRKEYFICS